jgi:hypothetical protein
MRLSFLRSKYIQTARAKERIHSPMVIFDNIFCGIEERNDKTMEGISEKSHIIVAPVAPNNAGIRDSIILLFISLIVM